jgi:serine/threonine-protein kinase HipA
MMSPNCLFCCKDLNGEKDFHQKCSQFFFGSSSPPEVPYSLGQIPELAKHVVERSVSVPGVQPKLSMTLVNESGRRTDARLTVVGALGGLFIFKPPAEHYPELPENEHITMRIAGAFGIRVVPSCLIRLKSGELSYMTRRVDRDGHGGKIHMIDMFQVLDAYDKYKGSMEKIGKALDMYSDEPLLDKMRFFELAVFSFLSGNSDMHLKNFSMIETPSGWVLAPAYDLLNVAIANPADNEELALTLKGRKNKLEPSHFVQFGRELGLNEKQVVGVFHRLLEQKDLAFDTVHSSFLTQGMQDKYISVLEERYSRLYPGQ